MTKITTAEKVFVWIGIMAGVAMTVWIMNLIVNSLPQPKLDWSCMVTNEIKVNGAVTTYSVVQVEDEHCE